MGDLKTVSLKNIRASKVALRQVDRTSEAYLGLVESIKLKGFSGAITARPKKDEVTGEDYYEIVDGLHRYSACKDANVQEIGIDVQNLDDDEVLEAQIMANLHRIETSPSDYARQLKRMLGRNPMMTEAELASKLGKSPNWIKKMLGLNKITDDNINTLVNTGKIPLMSAYALAKLPETEQAAFVDRAMSMTPKEFVPLANDRAKEIRDAARKGKAAGPSVFEPRSHARKLKDIQAATADRNFLTQILANNNITDPVDGAVLILKWCQHLDPASEQEQENAYNSARDKREAEKEKRKIVREEAKKVEDERKQQEAAEVAAAAHETLVHGSN